MEKRPESGARRPGIRLLLIAGVVAGLIAGAAYLSPRRLSDWDQARILPPAIILIFMVLRLTASTRPLGTMAKQMAIFLAFGAVLVVGYSYRDDFNRISDRLLGAVVPGHGTVLAPGIVRFEADEGGQFAIDATVNGTDVHFLMDTGASEIVLSKSDAIRLGIQLPDLRYSGIFSTANGMVRAAPIPLNDIKIGPLYADLVTAWVNEGDLDQSLLGMRFLSTLGRIEIRGHTLILEQNSN